jgi:DNA replication protein DnaC
MNLGKRYWSSRLNLLTSEQEESLGSYPDRLGFAIRDGIGVFLWGPNSTGKSFIAAALCIEATARFRVSSYMIRAAELKEAFIKDYPANPDSTESVQERINEVSFLVIDDLGKEYRTTSGFSESAFGSLLRDRCRRKLTTSLTLNLGPDEFLNVYGPSTWELAKECMLPIKLEGTSRREKIHKKIVNYFLKGK